MKATLILANGARFQGAAIGVPGERVCELVCNTAMSGCQEILADPSYAGQGVVMSYPIVGGRGIDSGGTRPWAEAVIVRRLSPTGREVPGGDSLDSYLRANHVVGIEGVDTRAVVQILRSQGTMNGMIACGEPPPMDEVMERLRTYRVSGAVGRVTTKEQTVLPPWGWQEHRVALMDYGVKQGLAGRLRRRGCQVTVFPARTPAEKVLAGEFDGVVLSNGPGDPADDVDIIREVRALYRAGLPLFAVGLGHQLLALATGAKTRKMAFGHRGSSHPVKDLETGRCFITGQNHGYVVDGESVDPAVARVSHLNVTDGTVEGLGYARPNCISVQFQPEGDPGPMDAGYLFDRFAAAMGGDQ